MTLYENKNFIVENYRSYEIRLKRVLIWYLAIVLKKVKLNK